MYLRTSKVSLGGEIVIPAEFLKEMGLSADDQVAFIYEDHRLIIRKLTSGEGRMTFEEHLLYRDIKIRNEDHERIVRLFYVYAGSVTGNGRLYPDLVSRLFDVDLSDAEVRTACLNGIFDGTEPPYGNVDLYIKFSNDVRVYVYGSVPKEPSLSGTELPLSGTERGRELKDNEYVLVVLGSDLDGEITKTADRHVYIR